MKIISCRLIFFLLLAALSACGVKEASISEKSGKVIIYQMLPRLFGNKVSNNKLNGSKEENGTGKFDDITEPALQSLKELGITHVWYTGVLEHATMTDYSAMGIKMDDPDVVKGRAGSPYAIKDYYDVDPDLANDVKNRMAEFENLVQRTHEQGLKVLIDFIPNHVARSYSSDAKPEGVENLGFRDDTTKAFSPTNDFYYIPGKALALPAEVNAGGSDFKHPLKDGKFDESPAKATGNNVFSEKPGINDWFETVKLNYGEEEPGTRNQEPRQEVPGNGRTPVWNKMRDILIFWAKKDVDGFRCDVAEMVPVEFWEWVIPQVKKVNPDIIFLAEAYDASKYAQFVTKGKFDYLYDKVGMYDALKRLIRNEPAGNISEIRDIVDAQRDSLHKHMLRFLENHDEERIASKGFAGDPLAAVPAMVASATLSGGPVLIYSGQELGEPGAGIEGFGGDDNRTTIFDYWGVPEHQKWMNGGKFDGGGLSASQKSLRAFYGKLLNLSGTHEALLNGKFRELAGLTNASRETYAYIRESENKSLLIILNFS
ncbi:MAG: alpha-amylase family protein, partial [Bacteroidota bacterium]